VYCFESTLARSRLAASNTFAAFCAEVIESCERCFFGSCGCAFLLELGPDPDGPSGFVFASFKINHI
jgi:hypothetical protein